jgi:hypothetical protein
VAAPTGLVAERLVKRPKVWLSGESPGTLKRSKDWMKPPRGGTLDENEGSQDMAKITSEQMKVLREWREETIEAIQDIIGSEEIGTSLEDEALATRIFDRLLDEDRLELPEISDPAKATGGYVTGGTITRGGTL